MKRLISLTIPLALLCGACATSPTKKEGGSPTADAQPTTCAPLAAQSAMAFIELWAARDSASQDLAEAAGALRASWPAGSPLIVARAWRVDDAQWMALLSPDPERASGEAILLTVERSARDGMWRQAMPAQVTQLDTLWPSL